MNHNLLTVTDGRRNDPNDPTFGTGPYLINEYGNSKSEGSLTYDRVTRQIWGGDVIDFHYSVLAPEDHGTGEVLRTTLNDRNGNVTEHYFDMGNRKLREVVFSGRADPAQPTTPVVNRPLNQLRSTDPGFYETRWQYTLDSQIKMVVYPNGNSLENFYETDLDPLVDPRFRANLRMKVSTAGPIGGDQNQIVEEFEYDVDFGCASCGFNFVTRHVDGRGNETLSEFDDNGNLIKRTHRIASIVEDFEYNGFGQLTAHVHPDNGSGHRRRDEFTYHDTGSQTGYRKDETIDVGGFALKTAWAYDARGNATTITDPRGNDRQYTFNQLDQVVRERSEEVQPGSAVRYDVLTSYDANDNVVRRDIQNVDSQGTEVAANPAFTTTFEYEVLNYVTRKTEEVDPGHNIVTEYAYDKNRNQTLTRYGEATNGNQPENTTTMVYDERNLVFQQIRAAGHADQSTTQFDYDGNRNRVAVHQGLEDQPRVTTHLFDGFDRMTTTTDPMGNVTTYGYDANHNMVLHRIDGERSDILGSTGNERLFEAAYEYDLVDRKTHRRVAHFDSAGVVILDGESTTVTAWSDFSQILSTTDDNGNATTFGYDTANRLLATTDAKGNSTTNSYDSNSNLVTTTEIDKSDLATPDEIFVTQFAYDGTNRQISVTDNLGNLSERFYDSRDNEVRTSDGMRVAPNQPGNRIEHEFDGLNRMVRTIEFLTDDGTGSGTVIDAILTEQSWDDSSRLVSMTDDNANSTSYAYDPLDRRITETFADNTVIVSVYDTHDDRVGHTDQNGSSCTGTFDDLGRLIQKDITPAPGVLGVTLQTYQYDGLSRRTRATDNNNPAIATDDSIVEFGYDSLSHLTSEIQNGKTVQSVIDGVGRRVSCTYPDGRVIIQTHDTIDRVKSVQDQGAANAIAEYEYIGVSRVLERRYANGTKRTHHDGAGNADGYDGLRREVQRRHVDAGGNLFSGFAYAYDKAHNRRFESDLVKGTTDVYQYDSKYRLIHAGYDAPIAAVAGVTNNATVNADVSGLGSNDQQWTLDGVGNWLDRNDSGTATAYTPNVMNEYDDVGGVAFAHDDNGNLQSDGDLTLFHDHLNRLVRLERSGNLVASYAYDAVGRRISKILPASVEVHFYYDQDHCIEERDAADQVVRHFVYGVRVDEPLEIVLGSNRYFYHGNSIGSVKAITNSAGSIEELYDYNAYGNVEVFAPDGVSTRPTSILENPYMFTGRRLDMESGLHYYRARYFSGCIGRFVERDPIGYLDGMSMYEYVDGNPINLRDPFGLYGTRSCAYYRRACKEHGGHYYCIVAPVACIAFKNFDPVPFFDDPFDKWRRCTRKCLQDCSRKHHNDSPICPPGDHNGFWDPPHFSCHNSCYKSCAGFRL